MGARTLWLLRAGTFALSAIILGSAIAQAIRQHNLDPVMMVGWLPAVVVAGLYRALTGRDGTVQRRCLSRMQRTAGS
jgi:hypothetical protein